ncbi:MAG: hypothetical protein K2H22_04445 [Muribaculaceae bacterium]|nr:hypothetical protein [Muribaculaceae bacterium]
MKELVRIAAMGLTAASLLSVATLWTDRSKEVPAQLDSAELSWIEFCKARGYDIDDQSEEIVNEFLDTWRGSVEEERAFNNLPALEE